MEFITPQTSVGQTKPNITVNRDAPGGGARPIAEQPGIAPDQVFQGLPPDNSKTKVIGQPEAQDQPDRLKNLFTPAGILKTEDELARE